MGITAFSTEQELSDTRISLNGKPKIIITNNSISFTRVYSPIKTCQRNFFLRSFSHYNYFPIKTHQRKKNTFVSLSHYNSNRPYNLILQVKRGLQCMLSTLTTSTNLPFLSRDYFKQQLQKSWAVRLGHNKLHQNFLPQLLSCRSFAKLGGYLRFSCYWL